MNMNTGKKKLTVMAANRRPRHPGCDCRRDIDLFATRDFVAKVDIGLSYL
jgi:hypothetical protein